MPDLVSEVVDFVRTERQPIAPQTVAVELVLFGAVSELWSTATADQWAQALEEAIKRGLIVQCGDKVKVAPPLEVGELAKPKQMSLFD